MQADRKKCVARGRIVDFGDQCVAQLTELQTEHIAAPSDAAAELEPCHLPKPERGFGQNSHAVIQTGDEPQAEQANAAGIRLMGPCTSSPWRML
jgi:hypothetical protein